MPPPRRTPGDRSAHVTVATTTITTKSTRTSGISQRQTFGFTARAYSPLASSIVTTVPDEPRPTSTTPASSTPAPSVSPLDVDAVRTVQIGTALWAVALVATLIFRDQLHDDGREWWIWTCVAGVILGLMGIIITIRRRKRIARAEAQRS